MKPAELFERVLEMDPQNEIARLNLSSFRAFTRPGTRRALLQELRTLANQMFIQGERDLRFRRENA